MRGRVVEFVPGLLAGVMGGVVAGYLVGVLLQRTGYWMPIVVGAVAGLACGQASPVASKLRGVVLGLLTLGIVVGVQYWQFTPPFETDGTLVDYVRHLPQLPSMTLVAFAVNVAIAYYWGREQGIRYSRRPAVMGTDPRPNP